MSFEINPVLAGKFDTPDYASTNNIAQTTSTDDVSGPDSRRYTKFDHSATEAGSTTNFSFSDLVDMVNPLEHIPVVSSIYRAMTGEQINPVSRVAGDILYGSVLGAASAVFGGVSAVADAGLESQTGKDSSGLAIAALFGPEDDKSSSVQLASAGTPPAAGVAPATTTQPAATRTVELAQAMTSTPLLAAAAMPENMPRATETPASPPAAVPTANTPAFTMATTTLQPAPAAAADLQVVASSVVKAQNPVATPDALQSAVTAANASPAATASSPSTNNDPAGLGAIPITKASAGSGKQAFGGIMSPSNPEAQDMAVALAEGSPSTRMGHTIYTNKFVNGQRQIQPRLSSTSAGVHLLAPVVAPAPVLPATFATPTTPSAAANFSGTGPMLTSATTAPTGASPASKLPAAMLQDMMMKALNQYGNVAAAPASMPGTTLNLVN